MTKYKLIAVDVDGTLLNSKKELTDYTRQTILQAINSGVIFCISTGRPIHAAFKFTKLFGIDDLPFILYNGAEVVTGPEHTPIFQKFLSSEDSVSLIELGKTLGTTVIAWADEKLYVSEFNERTDDYQKLSQIPPLLLDNPMELAKAGIAKVLWYDTVEGMPRLIQCLNDAPVRNSINYFTSNPKFLELVDKSCSKALALEKLAEYYGITREEVIAIGDGYNDLPMLEYAGLGVAMGNASEEIKAKSDAVTLSNDEDGVAAAIRRFLPEIFLT